MNKKFEIFLASALGAGICVMIAHTLGVPAWMKGMAGLLGGVVGSGFFYKPREAAGILKESFRKAEQDITLEGVKFTVAVIFYLTPLLLSPLFFSHRVAPFFGLTITVYTIFIMGCFSVFIGAVIIAMADLTPNGFLFHLVGEKTTRTLKYLIEKTVDKLQVSIFCHPILLLAVFLWPIFVACFLLSIVGFVAVSLMDILRISVIAFMNAIVIMADSERLSVMAGAFVGGLWYMISWWGLSELLVPLFMAMLIGGASGLASHGVSKLLKKKFKILKIPYTWECLKV